MRYHAVPRFHQASRGSAETSMEMGRQKRSAEVELEVSAMRTALAISSWWKLSSLLGVEGIHGESAIR